MAHVTNGTFMRIFSTLILKNFLFIVCFILFAVNLRAQEIAVNFKITNPKQEPVPFASVTVINSADTLQMGNKTADGSGVVKFNLPKGGLYIIRISSVNYQSLEKGIMIGSNQNTFTFSLEALPKTLRGVVVRSSKPLMRQEDDKTIIDPENLAAASTNGYEILEKTPGLFVDQDGNIYISSLTPAAVQINGRDMKMSAADMATLLKSLPPNSIDRIEVVRTPSAKYDASSTGGIVNVVLKKGVKIGKTGSVNAGMQQGSYGNRFAGFTLNNNDG
ncbi:MAG TPA: TonB-dependent receptor plug domain-containing protein, partial [Chitinophagaceae bacterium]|nr:TonB-dependent receptor plug domain-containing protein [Chitinophagaceae bacterium]